MEKISSIGDFYLYCSNYSHVSFDVFDTLIRRRLLKVNEVHDTVSAYALALVGRRKDSSPFDLTLLRYRMSDSLKSFDGQGTQEPLLEDVWDRIIAHYVSDKAERAQIVEKIVDFEVSIESSNLELIDGARDLLLKLKASGKIMTAISDMYFSRSVMEKILGNLGIFDLFDHVYISADSKLTKQTGDLFRQVLGDLAIEPYQLLHVGDNPHSDVAMAKKVGVDCVLVEQHHLLELKRPAYGQRERIEEEVADLVKLHLISLLFDAADNRVEHIYFMARDGCAINDFLAAWDSHFVHDFLGVPEHSNLYLNRLLSCWGGVDFSGDWLIQAIGLVFWLNHGEASPKEMCERLGVKVVPAAFGTELLRAEHDTFRVADIFIEAGLKEQIKEAILGKRHDLIRYLRDVGFFEHQNVAFSDVGYSGTVLRDLNSLFVNHLLGEAVGVPPAMHLHLVATNGNYASNQSRAYPFVRFSPQVVLPVEKLPVPLLDSFAWLEFFFKHPTLKPILRFVERDGKLHPELRHDEPSKTATPSQRVVRHAAARDEDIVLLWMAAINFQGQLTDAAIHRFAHPDVDTVAQMSDEVFEMHSVQGDRRSILMRIPNGSVEAISLAAKKGDYWIPGSIVASRTPVAALAPIEPTEPTTVANRNLTGKLLDLIRGRRAASNVSPVEFDPKFYRAFYPDLRQFHDNQALWQHFFSHGKREKRVGTYQALVDQLVTECGPIPSDFDPLAYLRLNHDVAAHVDTPERALDHYMRSGRNEGRIYRWMNHDLAREFDVLLASGLIVLDDDELRDWKRGEAVLDLFLRRHGLRQAPWIDEIDVAEFRALNFEWAGAVRNKAECIVALLERGLAHQPHLSLTNPFDPEFYRRQLASSQQRSSAELYWHYLSEGAARGLAPSEIAALRRIWGLSEFPESFDWQGFAASIGMAGDSLERTDVLSRFIDTLGLQRLQFVSGPEAAHFTEYLANRAWRVYGHLDEARALFEAALEVSASPGRIHHCLGDLALQSGRKDVALQHFRLGIEKPSTDRWSFINAANLLVERGDYVAALSVLEQGKERWQQRAPWRRVRDRALHMQSRVVLNQILHRRPGFLDFAVADRLYKDIASTTPTSMKLLPGGRGALVLTMRPASSARWDRAILDQVTVYDLLSIEQGDYFAALLTHETVIFHEVPFTSEVLQAIALARSLGRRTVAWIGDFAEWEGLPLSYCEWNDVGANPSPLGLEQFPEIMLPARYCNDVVTTIAGCVPLLERVATDASVRLLAQDNAMAPETDRKQQLVVVVPANDIPAADLRVLAESLRDVVRASPDMRILIDQRLAAREELTDVAGRWSVLSDNISLSSLSRLIANADLVIQIVRNALLQFSVSTEARVHGVPALVLRETVPAGKRMSRGGHGTAVSLRPVSEPTDLSSRSELVARIEAAIRSGRTEPELPLWKERIVESRVSVPTVHAHRIMFANVFFAPQVIGGATRVMKDNIDFYLDHHDDEFELAVFCADEQNDRNSEWRIDGYRGIPVFRTATPQELNMDWRAANEMVTARFAAAVRAFKPDLVHIHCLQRLGVGVAEVCRELNIPYVVTLHDAWWLSDYPFLTDENGQLVRLSEDFRAQRQLSSVSPDASLLRAGRLRKALLGARERFAVSRSFAKLYETCGIPCRFIENGSSRIVPASRQAVSDGRVQLCHIGGLEHHKGAYLIEAALRNNRYNNLQFTVVDLAREAGDETHTVWGNTPVTITGKMSTAQIARFYAQMHVLIAPSTWPESYGLVTREALAHGLWVIASNLGAMADPVVPGSNGFVISVSDTKDLARSLSTIDADPQTYRHSPGAQIGLRTADDQSAELVEIYRTLLPRKSVADEDNAMFGVPA
ncbi:glycosyltransferase [Burkholderia cenocepacia]|uniref:glycosyltransferase n=1 Tax=Burkholderia cenocepacia TaxID=95486 RepID=UPI002237FBD5|nr:glycosyltransferase [Burkholderia cenocepacia]MCW5120884.1 glycosyltransferase [Burkholderia cenocepacia]MCW5132747.1 glycosyltransferase [Burkholderia cenocepacia]MCW5175436.1 glycosyltransferase [Burkholderia cenocepacia]